MKDRESRRYVLKLSGEALAGSKHTGFDEETVRGVARQIKALWDTGAQISIVTGGGNFWRGRSSGDMDRVMADEIGMLATVMNCIYVSDMCRTFGLDTDIYTPFSCGGITELFSKDRVIRSLEAGRVVFFAGGTGHPYFSTDTGVVLRAVEIDADCVLLAKSIDGVYDSDPRENKDAKRYDEISIDEVIEKNRGVVDITASVMARDNRMPMYIFLLDDKNSILDAVQGRSSGTRITV
ncbi:MAG: UMP kinase [Lachnospiraceae bacterium]|nr:UMP kinase [Lachnospiraceae bacterium]